jgi:transcriptional regulator with XRE-family HTH domain
MTTHLPSYVRLHRKHLHLSQHELAFLLGLSSQAVISQHESLARLPQTKVLLKYEALFGEPIGELFPKLRIEAEDEVAAQVKTLMARLEKRGDLSAAHKLDLLNKLIQRLAALSS